MVGAGAFQVGVNHLSHDATQEPNHELSLYLFKYVLPSHNAIPICSAPRDAPSYVSPAVS